MKKIFFKKENHQFVECGHIALNTGHHASWRSGKKNTLWKLWAMAGDAPMARAGRQSTATRRLRRSKSAVNSS